MKIFNKLKNALFEEEEIDIPIKEEKKPMEIPVVKEEIPNKISSKDEKSILEENERDLFKVENTFRFPDFDEEEFKTNYKPSIEEKKEDLIDLPKDNFNEKINTNYDNRPKQTRKENSKREIIKEKEKEKDKEDTKKAFKPSPVISPVYGILDKNYTKEDIMPPKEEKPKKKFDVDAIRKKAFGTLEDDIENTFEKKQEDFYDKEAKNIDDLLKETASESIDLNYEKRTTRNSKRNSKIDEENVNEKRSDRHKVNEEVKVEEKQTDEDLQVLDEPVKSAKEKFEEDTLENDLFDLIDSMYDDREDEE